jgi:hypothetical protein
MMAYLVEMGNLDEISNRNKEVVLCLIIRKTSIRMNKKLDSVYFLFQKNLKKEPFSYF